MRDAVRHPHAFRMMRAIQDPASVRTNLGIQAEDANDDIGLVDLATESEGGVRPYGVQERDAGIRAMVSGCTTSSRSAAPPAAWKEGLVQVGSVSAHTASAEERNGLHPLGDDIVVATFELVPKGSLELAARAEHASLLLGPFAKVAAVSEPGAAVGSRVPATT